MSTASMDRGILTATSTTRRWRELLVLAAAAAVVFAAVAALIPPGGDPAGAQEDQQPSPERQYPFLCTVEAQGLGQPVVDNQDGDGIPVYEEDEDGQPIVDADHIIGWSRDCELAEAHFDYFYVDNEGVRQHLWASGDPPPSDKPADVATTTTTDGDEVEYFIRQERGTINRFIYSMTMLAPWEEVAAADPENPSHDSWNGKLTLSTTAGGVGIGHSQGSYSANDAFLDFQGGGAIGDSDALARGYVVITSSGLRTGTHYNLIVGAETARQVKQHFIDTHGDPEYTVGLGSSGGAIGQYVYGEHSRGLVDAAIPARSFPDMTTQTIHVGDCELLERYMDIDAAADAELWEGFFGNGNWDNRQLIQGFNSIEGFVEDFPNSTAAQLAPITGQTGSTECIEGWRGLTPLGLNPLFGSAPGLDRLDPEVVAEIQWTHWDDVREVYGTDPDTGFPLVPWDNVGVQYGLRALQDGEITPEQFLDLNARVGSWVEQEDMVQEGPPFVGTPTPDDFDPWSSRNMRLSDDGGMTPAPRREGDLEAIASVYESGLFFSGDIQIPVIDVRQYLEAELDQHNSHQSFAARQRIIDTLGHADHQAIWFYGDQRTSVTQLQHAFDVVDEWLANMADGTDVVAARPDAAADTCWDNDGNVIASGEGVWDGILDDGEPGACTETFTPFTQPRIEAGGPISGDIYKCHTMPVSTAAAEGLYSGWSPDGTELARLEAIFPDGVCDFGLPGVARPGVDVADAPDVRRLAGVVVLVSGAEPRAEVQLRAGGEVVQTRRGNPLGLAVFVVLRPGDYVISQTVDGQRSLLSEPVTVQFPGKGR